MSERTSENLVELLRKGVALGFGTSLREQAAQRIEELEDTNAALLRTVDRQSNLLAGGSEHAAICVPIEAAKDAEIERLREKIEKITEAVVQFERDGSDSGFPSLGPIACVAIIAKVLGR